MKHKTKIKNPLKRFAYRWLRNDMVARMRGRNFSWTKINQVLRSMGQHEIKSAQQVGNGVRIIFFTDKDFKTTTK